MPSLHALPNEVLLLIAKHLAERVIDVVALSSTAKYMRLLAHDALLWRTFFYRIFGPCYAVGTPTLMWPYWKPDDPWSPAAHQFWRSILDRNYTVDSMSFMWSDPGKYLGTLAPFGHMENAGKNWHWLFMMHVQSPMIMSWAPWIRRHDIEARTMLLKRFVTHIVYLGDRNSHGARHGYGVELYIKHGYVYIWREAIWRNDKPIGWNITVTPHNMHGTVVTPGDSPECRPTFELERYTGTRTWRLSTDVHPWIEHHVDVPISQLKRSTVVTAGKT